MFDILGIVAQLRRPSLLVRTARIGMNEYCRERHLQRILRTANLPRHGEALMKLVDLETDLDSLRRAGRAEYSYARHIDVLIAIMGETALLRANAKPRAV